MNTEEYNDLINSLIHAEDPLIALCSSDVAYIRERYKLCEIKTFKAKDIRELIQYLNNLVNLPYAAYIPIFRIPREALKEVFCAIKCGKCGDKLILPGAIEGQNVFELIVGYYN